MDYSRIILEKLLDTFEKSMHYSKESQTNRRVILKCDSKHFPEYKYDDYEIRDDINKIIYNLKSNRLIDFSWERKNYIVKEVWLNVDNVQTSYQYINRRSKSDLVSEVCFIIKECKKNINFNWIGTFLSTECDKIENSKKLTGIWKKEIIIIEDFLKTLAAIDSLNRNSISMRAFSVNLFSDSKYFERTIKSIIIPILKENEPVLKDIDGDIDDREILTQVGIIMMPEVFEFSGNIKIQFINGILDFSVMQKGACINSYSAGEIINIEYINIERVLFIENKTNYTEYIQKNKSNSELVIYHGGFYSPAKRDFISIFQKFASNVSFYFWGDIDYGGFKMFNRLKSNLIPDLKPYNMSASEYLKYIDFGVKKSNEYISKLSKLLTDKQYEYFWTVIDLIVKNGTIVEQENFLCN